MALGIIGRDGRTGRVVLRSSDAGRTSLVLVLDGSESDPAGGIVDQPDEPPPGSGGFPVGRPSLRAAGFPDLRPFELAVDTSDLPAGIVLFSADAFVRRVLAVTADGVEEVRLSMANATAWGYQPQAPVHFQSGPR